MLLDMSIYIARKRSILNSILKFGSERFWEFMCESCSERSIDSIFLQTIQIVI